jgi:uncharacterized protein YtpQ (UPF0354 family)
MSQNLQELNIDRKIELSRLQDTKHKGIIINLKQELRVQDMTTDQVTDLHIIKVRESVLRHHDHQGQHTNQEQIMV